MNYDRLSERAHSNAVNHGFWSERNSHEHCLMLVVTEIAEAVQAHRHGRNADLEAYDAAKGTMPDDERFEKYVKDSVGDEMADTAIRLLDLAGQLGLEFRKMNPCRYFRAYDKFGFTENAFGLVKGLSRTRIAVEKRIQFALAYVEGWADALKIDLKRHILMKMRYNEGRPALHGKAY